MTTSDVLYFTISATASELCLDKPLNQILFVITIRSYEQQSLSSTQDKATNQLTRIKYFDRPQRRIRPTRHPQEHRRKPNISALRRSHLSFRSCRLPNQLVPDKLSVCSRSIFVTLSGQRPIHFIHYLASFVHLKHC